MTDVLRTLGTTCCDLLRTIKHDANGRAYQELQAAFLRFQTASINASIRAAKRRTKAGFSWLER